MDHVSFVRLFSSYPRSFRQFMARIKFIRQQFTNTIYSNNDNTLCTMPNQPSFVAQIEIQLQIYHLSCLCTIDATSIAPLFVSLIIWYKQNFIVHVISNEKIWHRKTIALFYFQVYMAFVLINVSKEVGRRQSKIPIWQI